MDPLIAFLVVISVILTTLLIVVGIQVIFILRQLNQTITRVNQTLNQADRFLANVTHPFANMGGMMVGLKQGLKLTEAFVNYLKSHESEKKQLHDNWQ